jgi:all-trans-retinol dehydrogenase (NAD+)
MIITNLIRIIIFLSGHFKVLGSWLTAYAHCSFLLVAPTSAFYYCDLASAEAITTVAGDIRSQHGNPTVLINNAGTVNRTPLLHTSDEALNRIFATNTLAPYRLLQAFLPAMIAADHGIVVTMASVAGYFTPPGIVDYSMSKAAVAALHDGLSSELIARYGAPHVRTVCVVPNFVRTKLADGLVYDSPFVSPMLEPDQVAKAVVAQVLSGRSGWVIMPKSAAWFGMLVKAWPWWMQRLLALSPAITELTRGVEKKVG